MEVMCRAGVLTLQVYIQDQEGGMRLALEGFAGPVRSPELPRGTKARCKASSGNAVDAGGIGGFF